MTKLILTDQYIPIIGEGKARWNNVHVADLAKVYLLLTEAAISKKLDSELWLPKGYYLVENGEHLWSDVAKSIARQAESVGVVGSLQEKKMSRDTAQKQAGFEAVSWGMNSRGKAERARKVLGWRPSAPSLEEEIPGIVQAEHERLQESV